MQGTAQRSPPFRRVGDRREDLMENVKQRPAKKPLSSAPVSPPSGAKSRPAKPLPRDLNLWDPLIVAPSLTIPTACTLVSLFCRPEPLSTLFALFAYDSRFLRTLNPPDAWAAATRLAMPVQRTIFGHPIHLRMPPRRFIAAAILAAFFLILLVVTFIPENALETLEKSPVGPAVSELTESAQHVADIIPKPKLPKVYNPFGEASHEPPEQANSTSGETRWHSDWKWLNPFSSAVTLDADRSVLPPLVTRQTIYTFYEKDDKKSSSVIQTENDLLLTWRRAWWAAGFKPIVLGKPEAMQNPLYARVQTLEIDTTLKSEMERILAWGHMGGGILSSWLALPMGHYEDDLLSYLRRGEYRMLTRYQGLKSGLFTGKKDNINTAIRETILVENLKDMQSLIEAIPSKYIDLDSLHSSVALYDLPTVSKYSVIAEKLEKSRSEGLHSLQALMNGHLHITWQNAFPDGISILKPHAKYMSPLVSSTEDLAKRLLSCPDTPMPKSCPPNIPTCKPCDPTKAMKLNTTETIANKSTGFTIATFPHPFTFTSMAYGKDLDELTAKFIRRSTFRDRWLGATTEELLGSDISGPQRLVRFKELVASPQGTARSFWLTTEYDDPIDLDWIFGFALPKSNDKDDQPSSSSSSSTAAGSTANDDKNTDNTTESESTHGLISQSEMTRSRSLLDVSKKTVSSKRQKDKDAVAMVEAWNLADTEAWRFVRAFMARRRVERLKWEEEEKAFAGSESKGRWFER